MIGKHVSHYRIIEKLGEGGMGVVYKAEDARLRRTVALKFLKADLLRGPDGEASKERFLREARAAARLDHPNICTVYDVGEWEGGTFLAMAYCDGPSLRDRTRSGPLPVDEVIHIGLRVARGLEEAHRRGIVHRDIKSANIMSTSSGDVRITDFGLAKIAEGTTLTRSGGTVGTAAYMAPEQLRGEPSDERADLWSLGVVLYEMATGELPFRADHEPALLYSILNQDPSPPKEIRPSLPPDLEKIILRAMERDPARRYSSAGEIRKDLEHLRIQEQVSASTDARPAEPPPATRRPSVPWIAAGAAALVVLVLAAVAFLPGWGRQPSVVEEGGARKKIVVLPFENLGAQGDAYFAAGMTEEITSRLAAVRDLGVISRTSAVQYDPTGKTVQEIGADLGVDYVLEGTVRWAKGEGRSSRVRVTPQLIQVSDDTHLWSETYDADLEDVFAVQSEIAGQIVHRLDLTLLEPERKALEGRPTTNLVAYQAYLQGTGRLGRGEEEDLVEAIAMFQRAVAADPRFVPAWLGLAASHRELFFDGSDQTETRTKKARAALDHAISLAPDDPEVLIETGYYYYNCHLDYDRALEEFAKAAENLPNDPRVLMAVGYIWRRSGLWEESISSLEQAFDLDPRNTELAQNIGFSYLDLHRFEEAGLWMRRALSIDPDDPYSRLVLAWTGVIGFGDVEEALDVLREAPGRYSPFGVTLHCLVALMARDGEEALSALESLNERVVVEQWGIMPKAYAQARANHVLGRMEEARRGYEEALTVLDSLSVILPGDSRLDAAYGLTHAFLGRKEEAIAEGRRAVEDASRDALRLGDRHWDLIKILVQVGEYDAALEEIERGLSMPGRTTLFALRLDPAIDPIREDPRFQAILQKHQT